MIRELLAVNEICTLKLKKGYCPLYYLGEAESVVDLVLDLGAHRVSADPEEIVLPSTHCCQWTTPLK